VMTLVISDLLFRNVGCNATPIKTFRKQDEASLTPAGSR
jgi:hypothetical protein